MRYQVRRHHVGQGNERQTRETSQGKEITSLKRVPAADVVDQRARGHRPTVWLPTGTKDGVAPSLDQTRLA